MPDARSGSRATFTRRMVRHRRWLAAAPIAIHAGHDHRAARPIFLHIGCRAIPHRVAARKIVRIDIIRFRLGARIDRHASRQPSNPDLTLGRRGPGWRCLRCPNPGRRGLRFRSGRGQQKYPGKGQPNCRRFDPLHHAHPSLLSTLRYGLRLPGQRQLHPEPKPAPRITCGAGPNHMRAGTRAKML
jgi:hypothetical protein